MNEPTRSYEKIRYEVYDGVARITLADPDTRNALSDQLLSELIGALEEARDDYAVRVVVLASSHEKVFSAGANLAAFAGERRTVEQFTGAGDRRLDQATAARQEKAALPSFKQYREKDGQFHFKLVDPKGRVLLQSAGFVSPRDAGQAIARLQSEGPAALPGLASHLTPLPDVGAADVERALRSLLDARD